MSAASPSTDVPAVAELGDYYRVLRVRWITVALAAIVGAGLAAAYGIVTPPTWEASSTVLLRPLTADPIQQLDSGTRLVEPATERQVARSLAIAQQVAEDLDLTARPQGLIDSLEVETAADADILRFVVTRGDADQAADVANAFAEAYLSFRNGRAREALARARTSLEAQLAEVAEEQSVVLEEIDGLPDDPEDDDEETSRRRREAEARLSVLQTREALLSDDLTALGEANVSGGEVISVAVAPTEPAGLGLPVLIAIGLIGGGLVGMILAFVRQSLDETVLDADMAQSLLGVPIVGLVEDRRPRRASPVWDPDVARAALRRAAAAIDAKTHHDRPRTVVLLPIHTSDRADEAVLDLADGLARTADAVVLSTRDMPQQPEATTVFDRVNRTRPPSSGRPRWITTTPPGQAGTVRLGEPAAAGETEAPMDPRIAVMQLLPHVEIVVLAAPPLDRDPLALDLTNLADTQVVPFVRVGHARRDEVINIRRDLSATGAEIPGVIVVGHRRTWGRMVATVEPERPDRPNATRRAGSRASAS